MTNVLASVLGGHPCRLDRLHEFFTLGAIPSPQSWLICFAALSQECNRMETQ